MQVLRHMGDFLDINEAHIDLMYKHGTDDEIDHFQDVA